MPGHVCTRLCAGQGRPCQGCTPEPHRELKRGPEGEGTEAGLACPQLRGQHRAPARPGPPHTPSLPPQLGLFLLTPSHGASPARTPGPATPPRRPGEPPPPRRKSSRWGGCRPEVLCLPLGGTSHPREWTAPRTMSRDRVKEACAPRCHDAANQGSLLGLCCRGHRGRGEGGVPWGGVDLSAARPAHSAFPTQQRSSGQGLHFRPRADGSLCIPIRM